MYPNICLRNEALDMWQQEVAVAVAVAAAEEEASRVANEEVRKLSAIKFALEKQVKEATKKLAESEENAGDLTNVKKRLEAEIFQLKCNLEDNSNKLAKVNYKQPIKNCLN